jgi:transcriptional regulator with XRE-family HTH domain
MNPAALLREARDRSGLTQAQVAKRAGVHVSLISAYERGRRAPGVPLLERLLAAAGQQLRVELEPLGADVDARVRRALARSPEERAGLSDYVYTDLAEWLDGIPYVVEGLAAAVLQGAPVDVRRVDIRLPDEDDALECVSQAISKRWWRVWIEENNRHVMIPCRPLLLRELNPSRWVGGVQEYQLRLVAPEALASAAYVEIGGARIPVVSLWEVETTNAEDGQLLALTRELVAERAEGG